MSRMSAISSRRQKHLSAGMKFGRLTVIERSGSDRAGRAMFRCQCECGGHCSVRGADLRSGHSKSCGCLRSLAVTKNRGKVQMMLFGTVLVLGKADPDNQPGIRPRTKWVVACTQCRHRCFIATTEQIRAGTARCECLKSAYTSWRQMIQRCENKNHEQYEDYGGRGISVCPRWRESFLNFALDMGIRPEGKTLDRKDNERGYEPGNCRWETPKIQAQSRRKSSRKESSG